MAPSPAANMWPNFSDAVAAQQQLNSCQLAHTAGQPATAFWWHTKTDKQAVIADISVAAPQQIVVIPGRTPAHQCRTQCAPLVVLDPAPAVASQACSIAADAVLSVLAKIKLQPHQLCTQQRNMAVKARNRSKSCAGSLALLVGIVDSCCQPHSEAPYARRHAGTPCS